MADIITAGDLASYLGMDESAALTLIVTKTNELVTEAWVDEETTIPARVWSVAINVAARALSNPKGLTSWTRSWDDVSRTERVEGGGRRFGLFLTDDDLAELNGDPGLPSGVSTIQTPTRDRVCPEPWC